jgi:plasmid stabilization system protein ParE
LAKTSLPYEITPEAAADLSNIAKDTAKKWGKEQARHYAAQLENCFHRIAEGNIISRPFSVRLPQVKSVKCEHHYVFYTLSKTDRPVIIAILYEHMNILTRLASRLS